MDIKLESLTGHDKSAKVGKINVSIGDMVEINTVLLQVETGKGNSPIKAKGSYKIKEIKVNEGEEVKIGDTLIKVEVLEENNSNKNNFNYFGNMIKGKDEKIETDLIVIGAGPGGYVSAIYAAKRGLKVVSIEKENLGGTCLNVGCIPTKALVKSSEVYYNLVNCNEFGLECENPKVNMGKIIDRKDKIKNTLVSGIDYLLNKNEVKQIKGEASFKDKRTIEVKSGRDKYSITGKNIIIATGSKISKINIKGIEEPFVLNSTTALSSKEKPKSITIIGGGVIGMEFAFMYSNLGVKVNVVEFADRLLTMVDSEISEEIKNIAEKKGITIFNSSKVSRIEKTENGEALVIFNKGEEEKYIVSEKVLVAIGREPNIEGLEIENANIKLNENLRGIEVSETLETNIDGIYAIGDVNNIMQLAHIASHQGIVAVDNILGENKTVDYSAVPNVIFTYPEIASVGLTEDQAKNNDIKYKTSKFYFQGNGKALTMGENEGFIKLVKDIEKDKIIGASIIGPDASSLVSTLTLIIKNNIKEDGIIETIFAHPTTGEVIHEAALELGIGGLHC
ncbi:dihydrolipoyl dehydrogenase [Clostridium septicum]|uniref:Dihydrolipoyl dehydrogenase n=1 Tax=Clostridium septicum TaxID=1504 RepID=A0A9N7JJV0_CLOSE|nr:dihydrolipoyl dehydrogenase [Clostridium septicum]AYE33246.1 dihydrolipoyl dehydrogenase [Clostridium septicum]MDU1313022.1 dihydrolipoyl dehydrogenase [Clostridium septicum]QAS61418.1 dihydrolipoyl dehydrogenase [Clostridium septicum]UEC22150.1 dihydrolipoyl dehydrogenase [Clostridium septicum]USR99819.1 dihydrolipoyl dehydrogenase [Clostridium septicum]